MNNSSALPLETARAPILLPRGWKLFFVACVISFGALRAVQHVEREIGLRWWEDFTQWGRFHLGLVNDQSSLFNILCPALLVLATAGALRFLFNRPPDWLRLPVGLVFLSLQVGYLSFRLVATLSLDIWSDAVVSILFFLSEVFIHFRIALGNLSLLRLTDRSTEADDSQRAVRAGEYLPTVDVFVPTYSEPVEMLRRTIIGCQALEYPRKVIYLLDDQRRPAMRQLAQELGCRYLDRPDNRHAKAGNLNHALPLSNGELVVCFDADFVPGSDFIQRTVGFFRDPEVAMVQTPQNFFNEDAVTRNLGLERALEDEQRLFFRTLQPGRDSMNAIVCHGSCFVVRRSALESIGGIPTETITEDWATSIKLQAAGYKLYYLNEALSAGMSADKCGEFVQQRSRWAQGTLQALFASTNPLTVPGLTWKQRLMHCSSIVYYLGSVSSLFNLIAPVLFLFFGAHLLRMTVEEMVFYRLPFMVGFYLLYSWLTCGTRSAVWTEFYEAFLAPSMGLTVIRSLIKPFGVGFRVTDKTIRRGRLAVNRRVALPFAILLALHVAGIAYALFAQRHIEEPEAFVIASYFTLANVATLWLCLLVAVDVAQTSPFVRFRRQLPCLVTWDDTGLTGETLFLSEGDVVLRAEDRIPREDLPRVAFVHLPTLDLQDVPVRLTEAGEGRWTFEFCELSLPQRRALITHLFCQPRQWDRPPRSEVRAMGEYLRAGLRIYPLAESP
jgi:cellulose synthase/poly-beta-1,6-N-acetylglucosamine synthase-like glycosyltransferase